MSTVFLFLILRRMTKKALPSAFAAALFAVHPAHVDSVAWIAERKDVLSALFGMLTIGTYTYYVGHPGGFPLCRRIRQQGFDLFKSGGQHLRLP
jgi:hypothetical protein